MASNAKLDACGFKPVSGWSNRPDEIRPELDRSIDCEIAIVGGGYTGLSAALRLRELGHEVILLEKDYCGFGASGRNAGHLTPTIGKDPFSILKAYGEKRGLELIRFGEQAVEFAEQAFQRHGIECDYEPVGNVVAAVHPSQYAILEEAAESARSHQLHSEYLDETAMRERGMPRAFTAGLLERGGGLLNPGKYIRGLRSRALKEGVQIFEGTPVAGFESGDKVTLHANGQQVRAGKVLLATNAFTPSTLGVLYGRVAPVSVWLFQTPPLSDEQLGRLNWRSRSGVYTAHESLESFRLTADNRIAGGSKLVKYRFGSKLPDLHDQEAYGVLSNMLRARFPELPEVEIESWWGGWIALVLDFLPVYGTLKGADNIHYCMGYNGHGVAQASMMGDAMAYKLTGRENHTMDVLDRRVLPFPPEPLRWIALNGIKTALSAIDSRLDRKVGEGR